MFTPRTHYQDPGVAEGYDAERFASLAGRVFTRAERRALERALDRLSAGDLILDAPCGTGRLTSAFLRRGLRIVGADISAEMLSVARRRVPHEARGIGFLRMDLLELPFADRSVSAALSIRYLVHVPPEERVRVLRELRRVSARCVIISLSLSTPWHRFRRRVKGWLGHQKPVRHPVTSRALAEELRQAGLREVSRHATFPALSEQFFVVCERI